MKAGVGGEGRGVGGSRLIGRLKEYDEMEGRKEGRKEERKEGSN